MISGLQIRAARAFLVWDRRDLSRKAVVSLGTIEQLETGTEISGAAITSALSLRFRPHSKLKASSSRRTMACSVSDCIRSRCTG
jgi:hypothetical protein